MARPGQRGLGLATLFCSVPESCLVVVENWICNARGCAATPNNPPAAGHGEDRGLRCVGPPCLSDLQQWPAATAFPATAARGMVVAYNHPSQLRLDPETPPCRSFPLLSHCTNPFVGLHLLRPGNDHGQQPRAAISGPGFRRNCPRGVMWEHVLLGCINHPSRPHVCAYSLVWPGHVGSSATARRLTADARRSVQPCLATQKG